MRLITLAQWNRRQIGSTEHLKNYRSLLVVQRCLAPTTHSIADGRFPRQSSRIIVKVQAAAAGQRMFRSYLPSDRRRAVASLEARAHSDGVVSTCYLQRDAEPGGDLLASQPASSPLLSDEASTELARGGAGGWTP